MLYSEHLERPPAFTAERVARRRKLCEAVLTASASHLTAPQLAIPMLHSPQRTTGVYGRRVRGA
jgi:hypothetical protein